MLFQGITPGNSWLGGIYLKDHKNYKENKIERNENKIIIGDFNFTICITGKHGLNKTQKLYRCGSNYTFSKVIVDNGLNDLWRRDSPDSSEFTRYNRSSVTRSWIDKVYTYINLQKSTKINHMMVSETVHYNAISLGRLPSKTKIGKLILR